MIVVVPMAGRGSRFANSSIDRPKPLIEVAGIPMIIRALKSLEGVEYRKLVVIALEEHEREFQISELLPAHGIDNFELVLIPDVTEGQLCTVLEASHLFEKDEAILIAPSDTFIDSSLGEELKSKAAEVAGLISVFNLPGDHWSFARTDSTGSVVEVAEKTRISDHASTGLYYFSNAGLFVKRATEMVEMNQRTKGEFYVIPLYQKYIDEGEKVGISIANQMWDMGNPEALKTYEDHLKNE